MNIFCLDLDPSFCAQYHCDKHVVKMILEYAQLLSTAHRIAEPNNVDWQNAVSLYKATHVNHPCAIWTRSSVRNYIWLLRLLEELTYEFYKRYGHWHKTTNMIDSLCCTPKLPRLDFTIPPQCMPDDCKHESTVQAYRNYYMKQKRAIAHWKTKTPEWFI